MTRSSKRNQSSPARASRRYLLRFGLAMVAYAITLPLSLTLAPHAGAGRWAIVLIPVIPFAALGWAVWRFLLESDELARKIQFEALAIAFAAGSVLTFGYGMLQLAGAPRISWLFVWPVYGGCWLVGSLVAKARYR